VVSKGADQRTAPEASIQTMLSSSGLLARYWLVRTWKVSASISPVAMSRAIWARNSSFATKWVRIVRSAHCTSRASAVCSTSLSRFCRIQTIASIAIANSTTAMYGAVQ